MSWLIKVKKSIWHSLDTVRANKASVGVLAFEISGLMSKLLHLWESLSDKNMIRIRNESISVEGVGKIVSNDDAFLLGLACAEIVENLRLLAKSVSRISKRCEDSHLRSFERLFNEFANTGRDPYNWVLSLKDVEIKIKKMDEYVTTTALLHRQMDELSVLMKKAELQDKLLWQKQQVKYVKERSLWCRSFDTLTSLMARFIFTCLARIKLVFAYPNSLTISLSASAAVYPSENQKVSDFFESNTKMLKPPSTTLGAAALSLHYANLIIVMEKMIRSPQLVGVDARDDLYSMLPNSVRSSLRSRLKGVGFSASDPLLARVWKEALHKILGWLSPLAHNMIKWQSERSFEHHNFIPKTSVLLLQTLYFANKEKTEAAITELLVGLNYIWRFQREMNAKALFDCCTTFKPSTN